MGNVNEVALTNWENFEAEITRIFERFEKTKTRATGYVLEPLFRGQADKRWHLRTTLERFSAKSHSIAGHYRLLLPVAHAVTSLTGRAWSLPSDCRIDESEQAPPPGYEFMIYLRHHGFPSPLLDWSRSPYVATFFAFAPRPDDAREGVAIYAYREYMGKAKRWSENSAHIIGCGPTVVTHERHYSQQCEYTICKKLVGGTYLYCDHEEAVDDREAEQDILTKYVIPISERERFLRKLDVMNISAYSLFRDENSLMQTLAYREIEKRGF